MKIGVLSDTHRECPEPEYYAQCEHAFQDCGIIIHAGDLVDLAVLEPFRDRQVFAVAGNTCNLQTRRVLPERLSFAIDGIRFGLCHGAGNRLNIVERMFESFPDADCIIFGHTHQPLCTNFGATLLVNPGSFMATGRYGHPGSYIILELNKGKVTGTIRRLPQTL